MTMNGGTRGAEHLRFSCSLVIRAHEYQRSNVNASAESDGHRNGSCENSMFLVPPREIIIKINEIRVSVDCVVQRESSRGCVSELLEIEVRRREIIRFCDRTITLTESRRLMCLGIEGRKCGGGLATWELFSDREHVNLDHTLRDRGPLRFPFSSCLGPTSYTINETAEIRDAPSSPPSTPMRRAFNRRDLIVPSKDLIGILSLKDLDDLFDEQLVIIGIIEIIEFFAPYDLPPLRSILTLKVRSPASALLSD
jgi:hypothetical protein